MPVLSWPLVLGISLVLVLGTFAIAKNSYANQMIFIASPECQACDDLKPFAIEAAEMLGVRFIEGSYSKDVPFPGYLLLRGGKVDIVGINSEFLLFQSLCDITANEKVCDRYYQIQSVTNQTSG